jgi:hypothetical protein
MTETQPFSPPDLILTLGWIDTLVAQDNTLAHTVSADDELSGELIELHCLVKLGSFDEANNILDSVLEKFASAQAVAFERRRQSHV